MNTRGNTQTADAFGDAGAVAERGVPAMASSHIKTSCLRGESISCILLIEA